MRAVCQFAICPLQELLALRGKKLLQYLSRVTFCQRGFLLRIDIEINQRDFDGCQHTSQP